MWLNYYIYLLLHSYCGPGLRAFMRAMDSVHVLASETIGRGLLCGHHICIGVKTLHSGNVRVQIYRYLRLQRCESGAKKTYIIIHHI